MPKVRPMTGDAVTLESAQTTLPAPSSGTDGGDFATDLRGGGGSFTPRLGGIRIVAASAYTLSSAVIYGIPPGGTDWTVVAEDINSGSDIVFTANSLEYWEVFENLGTFDRLAVGGTLSSAVSTTITYIPIEEQ